MSGFRLPASVRDLADKNFNLLQSDSRHPSLRFKNLRDDLWSVRIGLRYRALALRDEQTCTWIWIGPHDAYDKLIG